MEKERKFPIIMCNMSTSAFHDRFSTTREAWLCILYKDAEGKPQYGYLDVEADIELISFTQENEAFIYFKEVTENGFFNSKTEKVISKVTIPENIMFK